MCRICVVRRPPDLTVDFSHRYVWRDRRTTWNDLPGLACEKSSWQSRLCSSCRYRLKPNELGVFSQRVRRESLLLEPRHEDQFWGQQCSLSGNGTRGHTERLWNIWRQTHRVVSPKKVNWQPQVGFELDFTRFTADLHPQIRGDDGTVTTTRLAAWIIRLLFYSGRECQRPGCQLVVSLPHLATPNLPQGRIAPYIGIGVGVQRAVVSLQVVLYREVSYALAGRCLWG